MLFEKYFQYYGKICYIQIVLIFCGDVQVYQDICYQLEIVVGCINGQFGQFGWILFYYLNQYFDCKLLMKVFCYFDVGLVMLLCDGMNLVVKEYVVVQDLDNSGVLVLLQFVGVVQELISVLIVNFYDCDEVVVVLDCVFSMLLVECIVCYLVMLDVIRENDIYNWQVCFVDDLQYILLCSEESCLWGKIVIFFKLVQFRKRVNWCQFFLREINRILMLQLLMIFFVEQVVCEKREWL